MKKYLSVLIFLVLTVAVSAQQIVVLDLADSKPIKNVAVFNLDGSKSVITNGNGLANAKNFTDSDTLIFQHPAYLDVILPFAIIRKLDFQVKLSKQSVSLEEIVVSANKWEQNKSEIPNKIETLDEAEISFNNPQTAADLIGLTGEVFIQKSQLGGGSPMVRGFAANSILLVVDGVRLNNAIYRSGNLQNVIMLDPLIMQSAEVIFGPGSIIYGSDALGGVLDFHTKPIVLKKDGSKHISTNVVSRFSSASLERTFHIDHSFSSKKWGSLSSISYSGFGDLRMGGSSNERFDRTEYVKTINGVDQVLQNANSDIQKVSGYDQLNVVQKFKYRPSDKLELDYVFNFSTSSDIPRYDRLTQYDGNDLRYAEWYYGPQKWHLQALNGHLKERNTYFSELKFTAAYQNVIESRFSRKLNDQDLSERIENVDIFSLSLDLEKELNEKSTIFYGMEAVYNHVNSEALARNIVSNDVSYLSTRYPDGGSNYTSYAAYLSFKSNINSHFTFLSGIRYNYLRLKSLFVDKSFFDFPFDEIFIQNNAMNASIGLVYRPEKETQLNLNISSGFRAPNVDDVAKVFDSAPGTVIMPNEDLKPEKAYNVDLGVNHTTEKLKLSIVGFYTYLDRAMVRRPFTFNGLSEIMYDGELSIVESIVNAGHANIYGGSFSLSYEFENKWRLYTTHTLTKGSDDDGKPIRHAGPLFGTFGLEMKLNKFNCKMYLNYNGEISYDQLSDSERNKAYLYALDDFSRPYSPAWATLNIKTSYSINDKFTVYAGIENILDQRYRPYSSGISAPGRNLMLSLHANL